MMMKTLLQLLGEDAPKFRRYAMMAILYGLFSGLTISVMVPMLRALLLEDVTRSALWLVVLLCGVCVCWWWRIRVEKAGIAVGIAVLQGGRHRLGDHISRLPVGWFNAQNTARLSHVISQGVMEIAQLPAHVFTPVFSGAMTPLIIVISLFTINWKMGMVALVALPIMVAVFVLAARLGEQADQRFQDTMATSSQRIIEFAQAQSVLRAFNGAGQSTQFLEKAFDEQRQSGKSLIYLSVLSVILNTWVVQAIFAALIMMAILSFAGPTDTADTVIGLVVSLLLINRFVEPLLGVAGYGEALRGARNHLKDVQSIFDIEPLAEPSAAQPPQHTTLSFNQVSFRYPGEERYAIHDVNLCAKPGSMTALVGRSGSGKSTLMSLIPRAFDVTSGSITIGNVDLRDMSTQQLSAQISQIFQMPYLFQSSIADNIRVGKANATDAEVLEAAQLAGVTEILQRLPDGLDTLVGEGGARLSGGERQRISIARALIKDAPILLVDEATAALDMENQAIITQTLARLRGKRTLLVITHQLATIKMADQIVVLDEGSVKESGNHKELSASNGPYSHFLSQQRQVKAWRVTP